MVDAPLVIAVVSRSGPHGKIPEWEQQLSAGASTMNLLLAAYALGYAASWITEWYAYDRAVLDAFGLKAGDAFAGFEAEGIEHGAVIGVPFGDPARGIAQGIGGQQQIHGRRAGRQLLLPFRNLAMRAAAADHRDDQRRVDHEFAAGRLC